MWDVRAGPHGYAFRTATDSLDWPTGRPSDLNFLRFLPSLYRRRFSPLFNGRSTSLPADRY